MRFGREEGRSAARAAFCGLAALCLWGVALAEPAGAQEKPAAKATEAGTQQYNAAASLQGAKEYGLAIEEWNKFLKDFPDDPRRSSGRFYLGYCLFVTEKYAESLDTLDKLLQDDSAFDQAELAFLHKGLAQFKLGLAGNADMFDAAAKTFADQAAKFPMGKAVATAIYNQGESLYNRGKKAESIELYNEVVTKHPKSDLAPNALYALGVARQELGQHQEASDAFANFLRTHDKHPLLTEVRMQYAQSLFALGKYEEAVKWFANTAGTAGFNHADFSLLQQAHCNYQLKKFPEAVALFTSLPTKFPESPYITEAWLAGGKAAYSAGTYPAARESLAKVLPAGGDAAGEAAHWIARSWLKESNPAEALKAVEPLVGQPGTFAAQLAMDQADAVYDLPDRRKESVALYAAVAAKFPTDSNAPLATFNAAGAALDVQDYADALVHVAAFLKTFQGHNLEPDAQFIAADAHMQLQQYAEAEAIYAALAEKYPQHQDVEQWRVRRGLALYLQKKYPETIAALSPAIPQLKTPALLAEANYLLGSSQIEVQQYDPAVKSLEAALKADPAWRQADETQLALAAAQRALDKLPEARATLTALIGQAPNSPVLDRAWSRFGDYAYAQADYKGAATAFQVVIDKYPQSPLLAYSMHGLGLAQLAQNDFAAANQTLSDMLTKFPDHALASKARYNRAVARQQLKEFTPAIEDLDAFLKDEPAGPLRSNARYLLGLCQAGLDKQAEAAETFRGVLTDDPMFANADKAYFEMAWSLKAINKEAEAAAAFGELAAKFPSSPLVGESQYQLGEFQYATASDMLKQDQAEPAKAEFTKAVKSYTEAANKVGATDLGEKAFHKLGWAWYRVGDYAKSQAVFATQRKSWAAGPLASDAAFMEGESWFKQAKYAEAMAAYAAVKEPSGQDFAALSLLHAGQSASQLKKWDEASKLLADFQKQFPESDLLPDVLFEQGFALQNLNKPDEAIKFYESACSRAGTREVAARARFMVGEVYFAKKDHQEAVRHFFKVAYGYGYPTWQAYALYEAGRCFEVLKKSEQAVKAYMEVVEKFP
ncbi:MAG: tetratricopeptide repeat protein, partial [Pirellulales bacterium]